MSEPGRDLIGGVAASVIGACYLLLASQVRSSALDDALGPGGMPKAYGWAILTLGMVLIAMALLRQWQRVNVDNTDVAKPFNPAANAKTPLADSDAPSISRQILRAGGLLICGIGYVLLVETLGYPASIALLIVVVALYMGERASFRVLLIGVVGALAMWIMFVQLLGVAMPAGLLNFF